MQRNVDAISRRMSRKQVAHCLGQRSYLVESKLSISLPGQVDLVVADLQAKLKLWLYKESEGVHRFNVRTVLVKRTRLFLGTIVLL